MPLVACVLEMLRTAYPSLEIDLEDLAFAPREPEPEPPKPEAHARRRPREERSQARKAPGGRPVEADPVLLGPYAHLGVPPGADLEVVRSAWRRLVREHHPDLHAGHPELQRRGSEQVKKINGAYDEIKRRLARRR